MLETDGRVAVALPGPPSELQRLWARALETEPLRRLLARARPPGRRVLRFFGASESAVAAALAEAGGEGEGMEATVCARDFEVHVDLVVDEGGEARADTLVRALRARLGRYLFAEDERPVEELVLALCRARGLSLATAESCTGGLVAARLTSVPGSSDVFRGAVVSYADEVKERELGVPAEMLARFGAVSAETGIARGGPSSVGLGSLIKDTFDSSLCLSPRSYARPRRRFFGQSVQAKSPIGPYSAGELRVRTAPARRALRTIRRLSPARRRQA